jgi:hypothetical protein
LVQAVELIAPGKRIAHAMASDRLKGSTSEVGILGFRRRDCLRGIAQIIGDVSKVEKKI